MKKFEVKLLKREEFKMNTLEYGRHEASSHVPEYRDKNGNKIPYEKTKWYQLGRKKKND
jgi:hypothetical protein